MGEARQKAGDAMDNEEMEARGRAQEMKGKAQSKNADLREAGEEMKDAARKAIR